MFYSIGIRDMWVYRVIGGVGGDVATFDDGLLCYPGSIIFGSMMESRVQYINYEYGSGSIVLSIP